MRHPKGHLLLACGIAATATGCMGMPRASYQAQSNAAYMKLASPSVAVSANIGAGTAGVTNLGLMESVVFQDGAGSVSYHAPTLADLPKGSEVRDVHGRACESGLQVPWGALTQPTNRYVGGLWASAGWGDSTYQRALQDAANQVAPGELLYDVRVDLQTINVLSIWRQSCLLVTASALTRQPVDPEPTDTSDNARADNGASTPTVTVGGNAADANAPTGKVGTVVNKAVDKAAAKASGAVDTAAAAANTATQAVKKVGKRAANEVSNPNGVVPAGPVANPGPLPAEPKAGIGQDPATPKK